MISEEGLSVYLKLIIASMRQVLMLSVKNLLAVLPALLIALLFVTPFIVSDQLYNGIIVAKEFWFFGVVAAMLLYSGIRLLFKKGGIKISLNNTDILLLAFYVWCFIRAIFTPYTPFYHNHKLQVLTGMMVVYFFIKQTIILERKNHEHTSLTSPFTSFFNSFINKEYIIPSFLILLFLLTGFIQAVYGLLQLYGILPSLNSDFKITGSFLNPAPYAFYLSSILPIALTITLFSIKNEKYSKAIKYIGLSTLLCILLILPATLCRAAWLGALSGGFVVFYYRFNIFREAKKMLNTTTKIFAAIVITTILFGTCVFYLYHFKSTSANGRMLIWKITTQKIKEKPFVGVGLSRFEAEYNNWQAEWFSFGNGSDNEKMLAGNVKFAYNEFLEILSETGLIGLVVFLILISIICKEGLYIRKTEIPNRISIGTFSLIVTLITCSLFSYPLFSLPTMLMFIIGLAIFSTIVNFTEYNLRIGLPLKYAIAISMVLVTFISLKTKFEECANYKKWNYALFYFYNTQYNLANDMFSKLYLSLINNGDFLLQYGKSLEMEKKYSQSARILESTKNIYSDPYLYITLGDCYNANKEFEKAEQMYLTASNMIPNKIYAKYKLARLYDETHLPDKALFMAKSILNIPIKVKSHAIEEIHNEMKLIISKYEMTEL
ncbi:MAG: O-antigen ligase family protein [Bacteroidales bacterium]|nr:O-antigen ligase family protein [Bacteroidales bacterium]